ncbi:MAG TPA: hypothetical protein VGX23_35510 [Actinocrinis sp.]|nr:hypothetical protein [Actinocrinis sp.]
MSEPYDPNGGPWSSSGQQPQQPYGQNPDYGQPPSYGQAPYGQPQPPYGGLSEPADPNNPFGQSQGLSASPTMPYGQPTAYDQQQPYDQPPYGAVAPYGQPPSQGGYGDPQQGFYPQPPPQKNNTGKLIAGIGAVVVVVAIIAAVVLSGGGSKPTPVAASTSTQTALASASAGATTPDSTATTAPDDVTTTDSGSGLGSGSDLSSTSYTKGQCVNLAGDNDNLDVTVVDCSSADSDGKVVGIVSDGTTGDPTADAALCMPYQYDDNDFEETGDGDGTGVLYCLSATNGQHDLRYATKGSCIYRPSGDDVQTYVVDCSNSLANYVTLGVLTNTTSDSGCDKYSSDQENFFSPDGETPTYVVCAKKK